MKQLHDGHSVNKVLDQLHCILETELKWERAAAPTEDNMARNRTILQHVWFPILTTSGTSGSPEESPQQAADGEELLMFFNGDRRQPRPTHHCALGCCSSRSTAVAKAVVAMKRIIMRRLVVPALNRWRIIG